MSLWSRARVVQVGVVFSMAMGACSGGPNGVEPARDGPSEPDGGAAGAAEVPAAPTGRGSVEAFVHFGTGQAKRAAVGDIALAWTASPPSGSEAAAGATVTIGDRATTTGADGAFLLDGIDAGPQSLRVVLATGEEQSFQVSVVGDRRARVGTPPISRAEAAAQVVAQLEGPAPGNQRVIGPQTPLPPGTILAPGLGNQGEPDPALRTLTGGYEWLFFVDPTPSAPFAHRVEFVLVDAETGALRKVLRTSYPLINGVPEYAAPEGDAGSPDVVQEGQPRDPPQQVSASPSPQVIERLLPDHVPGCAMSKSYALVIEGSKEPFVVATAANHKVLAGALAGEVVFIEGGDGLPDGAKAFEITDKLARLKGRLTKCDTLFFFYAGHSEGENIIIYNDNPTLPSSVRFTRRHGLQVDYDYRAEPLTFRTGFPRSLVLSDAPACHIHAFLDTCYSGNHLNNLKRQLEPRFGLVASVISSADTEHFTYGESSYGFYFSYFLEKARAAGAPGNLAALYSAALGILEQESGNARARLARDSRPQVWVRRILPGETCGAGGAGGPGGAGGEGGGAGSGDAGAGGAGAGAGGAGGLGGMGDAGAGGGSGGAGSGGAGSGGAGSGGAGSGAGSGGTGGAAACAEGTACDDGNPCTTGDTCRSGICAGQPRTCEAPPTSCRGAGICDPSSGVCNFPPVADLTPCNGINPCTLDDHCLRTCRARARPA